MIVQIANMHMVNIDMKYDEARLELRRVLAQQQTVSIPKLRKLLQSMNVSLKDKTPQDIEIKYLKGEIKKLNKRRT